jgi:branched-chain amino acid transport system ATP-binding protein
MTTRLSVRGLTVDYAGLRAVDHVDLDIGAGQLVGLIGPNGAGKTTCVDAISGFTRATGTVTIDGQDIGSKPADARSRHGLARTWQSAELFDDLSVAENLAVAAERDRRWWSFLVDIVRPARSDLQVGWILQHLGIADLTDLQPDQLSHGQRKLVGIARALATRPSICLLDEPAAGLDTQETGRLGTQLRGLVDMGISLLLIEHDVDLVSKVCDQVYVLNFGKVIASGPTDQVMRSSEVVEAYLGRAGASAPPIDPSAFAEESAP